MKKTALFSLYNIEKVEYFAQSLIGLGWQIIATRETSDVLSKKGISVIDINHFIGIEENYDFPPTLHPKIEKYLISDKGPGIDLVYVLPYPLSVGNDIGGRTLLALAAKGKRIPIMSIDDMELVINEIKMKGEISNDLRQILIDKANALIANHYLDLIKDSKHYDGITCKLQYNLMNGENPYQVPAEMFEVFTHREDDALSLPKFKQISGNLPCFTNMADADCIIQTISLACEAFRLRYKKVPYVCIAAKHGNPCGMGIDWNDPSEAVNKALFGNPVAIWGGEVVVNFNIDKDIANLLYKSKKREDKLGNAYWMLDVILAPNFTDDAVEILWEKS